MAKDYNIICLREHEELNPAAAKWFSEKWAVSEAEYLTSMEEALQGGPVPAWYAVLSNDDRIIAGAGVIENDFHDRKDLSPDICALFVEEEYRCRGIAGEILSRICSDLAEAGITTVYLVTDHDSFYERYGWTFLTMANEEGGGKIRMYVHEQ